VKVYKSKKPLIKKVLLREWSAIFVNVINGLIKKSREHKNLVFVSTRHVKRCETETFNGRIMLINTSDPLQFFWSRADG